MRVLVFQRGRCETKPLRKLIYADAWNEVSEKLAKKDPKQRAKLGFTAGQVGSWYVTQNRNKGKASGIVAEPDLAAWEAWDASVRKKEPDLAARQTAQSRLEKAAGLADLAPPGGLVAGLAGLDVVPLLQSAIKAATAAQEWQTVQDITTVLMRRAANIK